MGRFRRRGGAPASTVECRSDRVMGVRRRTDLGVDPDVDFLQPKSLDEALELLAQHPQAVPITGGTDLLVELNFDRRRPECMLDLGHVAELREWSLVPGDRGTDVGDIRLGPAVRLGSAVTYTRITRELAVELPGLAIASRTVGSPQIRNRGTVGGNLGTASPAGDALPPLVAAGAQVEVASKVRGTRLVPAVDWIVHPKHSRREPDELIVAVHLPVARGPQQFAKIGTRNAMVIAVASFAVNIDREARTVGTGIGSAGPVTISATEADAYLADAMAAAGVWEGPAALDPEVVSRFGELVSAAARPIDDVRGTAAYRHRALQVMARRTLGWVWQELWPTDA